jgi:predicted ATPase
MPSLSSISISGYKSIRELKDFKLTNLNVLIGANGAGKSNFISIFRLLNEMYERRLQLYVQKQGGPDALLHFGRKTIEKVYMNFYFGENEYKFTLIPTSDNKLIFKEEKSIFVGHTRDFIESIGSGHFESKLPRAPDKYSAYVRPAIIGWRVYHFHDTGETAKIKGKSQSNDNLKLKPDAANLAAYLQMLNKKYPDEYSRIVDTIRFVAPFFGDFVHREDQEYIELEWTQQGNSDTPFKAHMLSDGTLRFICLATLLLQPTRLLPSTILIDEPELGLHPYAISILADIFKQVAEERQLIVSTQSVELVNELSPEDVIVVDQDEGASTFKRFSQEELSEWLKEYSLGELWKRNILGGRP